MLDGTTSRVLPDAGFCDPAKLPKGPNGRSLCRRCQTEVPKGQRTFCSNDCVHEWKIRTQPGYAAAEVLKRDQGVCNGCGIDCVALLRELKDARHAERKAHCDELGLPGHLRGLDRRLWEMNHRVAVIEGGGSCGLDNLETLCWKCHAAHTKELAGRRAKSKATIAPKPFLKWAGGKRRLAPRIVALMPSKIRVYNEPCLGAGAVFFALAAERRFERAVLSDTNAELIGTYLAVRDSVDELVKLLKEHARWHSEQYYYRARAAEPSDRLLAAARFIYLNKTGFNGLYRVNQDGDFNVPFGRYKNPQICDESNLRACSEALQGARLSAEDFELASLDGELGAGDAVYFDPPYFQVTKSSFVAYAASGFTDADHARLEAHARKHATRGVCVVVSNADTEASRELYRGWQLEAFGVRRPINSDGAGRGESPELLVHGTPEPRSRTKEQRSGPPGTRPDRKQENMNAKKLNPPRTATPTLHAVVHRFTPNELIKIGEEAADIEVTINEAEERLKSHTKSAKGEIESRQSSLSAALRKLREKTEERDVEALTWIDEEHKVRVYIDADSHELIDEEPLTAGELQIQLNLEKGRVAGANGLEVANDDPQRGSVSAPVTIVWFGDVEHDAMQAAIATVDALWEAYGAEKVLIVFRHAVTSAHKRAMSAAKASVAVHTIGGNEAFWKFIGLATRNPGILDADRFEQWAVDSEIDRAKFKKELTNKAHGGKVAKDIFASRAVEAYAPELRINGLPVLKFDVLDPIKAIVDEQLEEAAKLRGDDQANASQVLTARNTAPKSEGDEGEAKSKKGRKKK